MSLPITTTTCLFSPPYKLPTFTTPHSSLLFHSPPPLLLLKRTIPTPTPLRRNNPFLTRADDGDGDGADPDDYDMDEDELEEVDNKKDFDIEYHSESTSLSATADEDIDMVQSKTFVSTQGWDSEMVVDYRINEDEFHKISLLHCDFFIRKPPDPDNDVYDFREMYVTPPDTDVYAIPKVLAPMPQKYIRCAMSDYGCYNVTEPPIDAPRDPLYKTEREIFKVTVPGGRNRDRKSDLLVIRDKGSSFKIIPLSERDNPSTVIERQEWDKTREDMEKHLSKLRDFSVSNWF
ncbi:uncharacterized protein LOC115962270 isoform X2 [Quercus lobata]|uniref:uncharacterized protein LOC115962270 isoform X2 n=1 Tax=Quercus lobata TaxID=97700 RepID=UPI001243D886|nr:uncharacterized protein LOC115962270 isoform X2 [Quercus lobata]